MDSVEIYEDELEGILNIIKALNNVGSSASMGDATIYDSNGEVVGYVRTGTSGAYVFSFTKENLDG